MSRGEKYIHVYEIELKDYESPIFYLRDEGILTLASDITYPYRPDYFRLLSDHPTRITRSRPLPYKCELDKVVVPFFGVRESEYDEIMKPNVFAAVQVALDFDDINNRSVYIPRKRFEDDLWEVGICTHRGYGTDRFIRNEMLEKHINRMMKLKVFW